MVIVKLSGGLGNQMFQYAFGRSLAARNNTELKLDLNFFQHQPAGDSAHVFRNYDLDIFKLKADIASEDEIFKLSKRVRNIFIDKALNKIIGHKSTLVREPHFHFSSSAYNAPGNVYLEGYWQSEKYFDAEKELIRADFSFKEAMSIKAAELLKKINSTDSVCVNVRRGDFVTNNFHGSFGTEYFKKAASILTKKIGNPTYFVFSDEIEWCMENLKFDAQTIFVSHDFAGRKFQDYLRLMSSCNHYIIPNSSFAWWAVWFNLKKDKIVIAPKRWFNDPSLDTTDLTPASWIRI